MNAIKGIVLAIRFVLEMVTALGLLSGVYFANGIISKVIFLLLGLMIILIWSKYGAPKSPKALVGINKLILEIIVYGIGILACFYLFGKQVGFGYSAVVLVDLILMYALNLQGN